MINPFAFTFAGAVAAAAIWLILWLAWPWGRSA